MTVKTWKFQQETIDAFQMEVAVVKFGRPDDALKFLSTQTDRIDYIFCDYIMPRMRGDLVVD